MLKLLLFAYVASCGISAVRSNPHKRSVTLETKPSLPSPNEGVSPRISETNSSCPCLLNTTPINSATKSIDQPGIQNFLPSPPTSAAAFMWKCSLVPNKVVRDDYRHTPGIGSHKLHTRAKVWNDARKTCAEEGGHLAIINSQAEAQVLLDLFNKFGPFKDATYQNEILLGIHDIYAEGEWVTVQGDSLTKTGFSVWSDRWGGQPDNGGGIQNCGAIMDDGKLDDVACNVPCAFFCEIPDA